MKRFYLLIGTLIVFTATASTVFGQQDRPQGNQNGTSIRSLSVHPALPDAAVLDTQMDPGPNLTAQGQPASYIFNTSTNVLTINVRVINSGTTAAGYSYLGYYLSSNTTISTSDIFLGSDYVTSLASGSYSNETITTNIAAYPGTWYIGFIIDYTGRVVEDNENDNDWYFTPSITVSSPLTPPDAPILLSPLNNAEGVPIDPILRWERGGGGEPDLYWLEVYDDLGTCVYSNSTTIKQQRVGPLATNAEYSWRVYAENAAGSGPYSAEWSFTTSVTPVLPENHAEIPRESALKPPYPNPFNPVTTIGFDLPRSSIVRLKIHDMLGREVETLIDGPMAAGEHQVLWHAEGLTSGIYLCRLETDGFVETRKLILQR